MNTYQGERLFSGILLIILSSMIIYYTFPSSPTGFDFVLIAVGAIAGIPAGKYFAKYDMYRADRPQKTKSNQFINVAAGLTTTSLFMIAWIWLGERTTGSIAASLFATLLIGMVIMIISDLSNRSHT